MGDERAIADITLQLLAKAGEIRLKEGTTMPSATQTPRLWSEPGVSVGAAIQSSEQPLPHHHIGSKATSGDRGNAFDSGTNEGYASYEPRGRHNHVTTSPRAARQHASQTALQELPSQTTTPPTTEMMKTLGPLPVRRAWRRRTDRASPDISQAPVVEAIMLHERGDVQSLEQQCPKCRKGEGLSLECVKIPGIYNGACSNCLMARASSRTGLMLRPIRSYSAERRSISATISPSIPKEDLIAVWNLIAGVVATQPQDCLQEDGSEPPGKKIEDAARLVARSADEWGHTVKEEGPESGKTPKTPAERSKLVRQATRIRETALQIAICARDWGEKLERKRSFSQLRK